MTDERADADDVDALYRAHRLELVRLALLLVDDRESAEDVVQDVFAAVQRRWSTAGPADEPLRYLRRAVVNTARSVLRRRRTVRRAPLLVELDGEAADAPALLAEEHREVLAALRNLPQRQREVIVLRYWSQLPEADIAATLGISPGAVKSSASRGRDAIAAALAASERSQS